MTRIKLLSGLWTCQMRSRDLVGRERGRERGRYWEGKKMMDPWKGTELNFIIVRRDVTRNQSTVRGDKEEGMVGR